MENVILDMYGVIAVSSHITEYLILIVLPNFANVIFKRG